MCCSRSSSPGRAARRWGLVAALLAALCLSAGEARAQDPCLECHGLAGLALPGRPLWRMGADSASGTHSRLTCPDCHKGVDVYPHEREPRVRCDLPCHVPGASHEAIAKAEAEGMHRNLRSPSCLGCHTGGALPKGKEVEALCTSCHSAAHEPPAVYPASAGAFGVEAHRRAAKGPSCPNCHGVHGVKGGELARKACGNPGCHPGASEAFRQLFDHGGRAQRGPRGGLSILALGLGLVTVLILFLHGIRGSS